MDTTAENRKSEGLYKVFQENFPITDTGTISFWSSSTTISTRRVIRSRSASSAALRTASL